MCICYMTLWESAEPWRNCCFAFYSVHSFQHRGLSEILVSLINLPPLRFTSIPDPVQDLDDPFLRDFTSNDTGIQYRYLDPNFLVVFQQHSDTSLSQFILVFYFDFWWSLFRVAKGWMAVNDEAIVSSSEKQKSSEFLLPYAASISVFFFSPTFALGSFSWLTCFGTVCLRLPGFHWTWFKK